MELAFAIRDAQLFAGSGLVALIIAWLTAPSEATRIPVWPTRLYLFIIELARFPGLREYSDSRKMFSRREQFLTTFFVWFFVLFVASVVAFGCGRQGC